jgi:hypothetical protein
MSRLVGVIFNLYKKCQILGTTPIKVKNRGGKKNENHLSKKSCYIYSSVLHSNWGLKNTRFDNFKKEIKNKNMILKK